MYEPTKLAIAGDWHGNAGWARHAIEYAADNGADVMVHVGDFGYWVRATERGSDTWEYLERVSAAVSKTGIEFLWLPGNHEHWPMLPGLAGRGPSVEPVHGNLLYLPIGYRWEWWEKKFMAVGGAFSIDRFLRKEGLAWWPEEVLTDEDVTWCCHQPHGVDVIFSHDCPAGVDIPGIGPDSKPRGGKDIWPPAMLYGAADHRRKMKEIWDKHRPQRYFHGHYHVEHETWYGTTKFIGLDMDGTRMSANVKFLTAADLK
ncbi:metallophosphoesterase [Mycobacterium phage ScoobyDoobyDoo]|nr:metallophosphoesterase [Mycobacterium phage ScoobyDoobyDoo]